MAARDSPSRRGAAVRSRSRTRIGEQKTFLLLGATGGTGGHCVSQVLADGHKVRTLAGSGRTPA